MSILPLILDLRFGSVVSSLCWLLPYKSHCVDVRRRSASRKVSLYQERCFALSSRSYILVNTPHCDSKPSTKVVSSGPFQILFADFSTICVSVLRDLLSRELRDATRQPRWDFPSKANSLVSCADLWLDEVGRRLWCHN